MTHSHSDDEANPHPRQPWLEHLLRLANRALGEHKAEHLINQFGAGFTDYYRNLITPRYALQDLLHLQRAQESDAPLVSLVRTKQADAPYRLHFYSQQERYLDEYLPVMENIGLRVMDQVQFRIPAQNGRTLFIKSFTVKPAKNQAASFEKLRPVIIAAISAVMDYRTEHDPLNKLTLLSGMDWQAIDVLRTYRNYFLQLNLNSTRASFHHALVNNPELALCLFNYFESRFRPDPAWADMMQREEQALMPLRLQLINGLADLSDANDDRILRSLFNLIDATMRSNYHLRKYQEKFFIAIKINSLGVLDMPSPRPQYEIYVHSVAMEGIHLRAGKVSRGGIRWSDRPDDFRTEILGLMQTQISKNALIIPTGAKGGFVLKKNGRKVEPRELAKSAYITLIQGLLDLTDNYQGGQTIPAPERVCHDDPDPYLVVAADKGTAQFSDIANGVAADYHFWLHDAFASGGSRGYDHKALGITARGAWECVKRHFRELGKDIQHEPFSVVGIGSMDGDVFGNGMLLSPFIRLKAAFSGKHIFLDPTPPDDGSALIERKRLFGLAGSSWDDYDRTRISEGGGVFLRSDPNIPISVQARQWLGIRYQTLDGDSLIRYLLAAQADLLWLGGIGTYVKSANEKHEVVGDPHNDNVRINANEIKALVVGEGANLGFTQKARIEYALHGGRINTDAVDNSAGVDTSDHEVNLKILLMRLHEQRLIADYQPLFNAMTEEVCQLVLANNIAQSLCLSLEQRRCQEDSSDYVQLAERLDAAGFLDRNIESFPSEKHIQARPGQVLTRPELAVLMAAAKRYLTRQIEDQAALVHDDCCQCHLESYFPEPLCLQFKNHLATHPLASRIKATVVSNKIINQAGCRFLTQAPENGGLSLLDQIGAYLTFDRVLDAVTMRKELALLDTPVDNEKHYQLLLQLEHVLMGMGHWALMLKQRIRPDQETVSRYRLYLHDYRHALLSLEPPGTDGLEQKMRLINKMDIFPVLINVCGQTGQSMARTVCLYHNLTDYLGLNAIFARLSSLNSRDPWERMVITQLPDALKQLTSQLINALYLANANDCAGFFELPTRRHKIGQYRQVLHKIMNAPANNLLPYFVLVKELGNLLEEGIVNLT